jgi:2-polyprenyl-6-methoxyphenol hydroxylase-like FAD-dependent oxidoreductase
MAGSGAHAVVVGASMAGLLAARALRGPYDRVTVLDRDALPDDATPRRGVPQGRQLHLLLSRGAMILGDMFPGLPEELEAAGVAVLRRYCEGSVTLGGYTFALPEGPAEYPIYQATRPFLESRVRGRVAELAGVEIVPGTEATGLLHDAARGRVTGVRLRQVRDGAARDLPADLVVDATGRSGRTPVWLRELGFPAPAEEQLAVDVMYGSRLLRLAPGALGPLRFLVIGAVPGRPRALALVAVEGGRWVLGVVGYPGHYPPTDPAAYDDYVDTIAPAPVAAALRAAEPLGDVVSHRFPANLRRRYDKLDRFPTGYLVTGDALCSFNPLYAQGMTVAALEAEALRACLVRGGGADDDLAKRFFRAAAKPVELAWQLATGADLSLPEVPGPRSPKVRAGIAYTARVQAAASADPVVADGVGRVFAFVDPPQNLMAPAFLARVMRARRGAVPAAPPARELAVPPGPAATPAAPEPTGPPEPLLDKQADGSSPGSASAVNRGAGAEA